ncbi:MAG: SUMF1/EgtB/PvdO family nonheme iron enzyme [Anaerolineae bacterium]|nr:SUMF1/EgtB/PvdO family nonheme iron enzyme [Anaerolineae bacterium]
MQTTPLAELFPRIVNALLPHMTTVKLRESWLAQAFCFAWRPLYDGIEREGDPVVFTTACVQKLLEFGCLPNQPNQHAAAQLLSVVRPAHGVDGAEIDRLIAALNGLCAEAQPLAPARTPAAPPDAPIQTLKTPAGQRTPTVFVSYSRQDTAFVERLMHDLQAAGHACWIDTTDIKGGEEWVRAIADGINNSYAFISVVSEAANASRWVRREFLWADAKDKLIFPVLAESCETPLYMIDRQAVPLHENYARELHKLLAALPAPALAGSGEAAPRATSHVKGRRALEMEYLDRLRFEETVNTEPYTPMAGVTRHALRHKIALRPAVMRPEYAVLRRMLEPHGNRPAQETLKFEDIIEAIRQIRRTALLGEPGSGKTTTLWKLAHNMVETALEDPDAPIPVLARLGRWTDPGEALPAFIARELGGLGVYFDTLLKEKRAALLLDGLNEIPVDQRDAKARQVKALFDANPGLTTVVSCREQDYTLDLGFDRTVITPLDPLRIREFVTRYLGEEEGETLFWKIAGDEAHDYEQRFRKEVASQVEDWQQVFWMAGTLPEGLWFVGWNNWKRLRQQPRSLMALAQNPYMLMMMAQVYCERGDLPDNRGQLFEDFVNTLLLREKIAEKDTQDRIAITLQARTLLDALAALAYAMQIQRGQEDEGGAVTARRFLDDRLLYLAGSASLLAVDEEIRFTHQLLQEYFAATCMQAEIDAGRLEARAIWQPARWWERTNWEETAILLAGLYSDDCTRVLEWIADANPEVAAWCVDRSGAHTPPATLERLRAAWLPRLTDLKRDPHPAARAAVGRALGLLNLDNRRGVGLRADGLPDIDWVTIPAGKFIYQNGKRLHLGTFDIARYPITYAQFQAFIDAPDGFGDDEWWEGLARREAQPSEQYFKYANHPRENVSWYDAMAFCRWLSARLGDEVRLPKEEEWEKAARGTDRRAYPWGNEFDANKCNVLETGLGQTSAVGIFPQGASPYGVLDVSGNVWEWCLNEYENPASTGPTSNALRGLRGGSSIGNERSACVAFRLDLLFRFFNRGFRDVRPHSS